MCPVCTCIHSCSCALARSLAPCRSLAELPCSVSDRLIVAFGYRLRVDQFAAYSQQYLVAVEVRYGLESFQRMPTVIVISMQ
jgi:hypothetical protein